MLERPALLFDGDELDQAGLLQLVDVVAHVALRLVQGDVRTESVERDRGNGDAAAKSLASGHRRGAQPPLAAPRGLLRRHWRSLPLASACGCWPSR